LLRGKLLQEKDLRILPLGRTGKYWQEPASTGKSRQVLARTGKYWQEPARSGKAIADCGFWIAFPEPGRAGIEGRIERRLTAERAKLFDK